MVNIPLLLMGCGGVGRQLLHHIISCRTLHSKQGARLRVVGVCDSKCIVVKPDVLLSELDDEFLLQLCKVKSSGSSLQELANLGGCQVYSGKEIEKKVVDVAATLCKSSGLVVVDCSASSEIVSLLNQVVNMYCCVVLANKKPLTSSLVGAGLPVISTINRIISSGDPIFRIMGSLSGTLGYVMSQVEGGRPFSHVVNAAKSLGYTEPGEPETLLLYFLSMGWAGAMKMICQNGFIPELFGLVRCEVGIQEVSKDSALGRLKGSDNVLEIYSRCYSEQPLVIQGAGAGNDTTAAGVLADILDLQDLFQH
ncbi:bifunctional aspartokinase/homoserine dehydrogenase 1 chloroplastic [Phtheirospermum japonicum]|uniref:homoserine dehydrogenase n=1 Tax=Phtheirospermum japonicum TaxID=374723 RepID=A0A830CNX2_9LAMI|nr:bifunctional aspartokinase/homoserine dehydrogenase 1 chloroplastic [Phtheirospermum japonicum]